MVKDVHFREHSERFEPIVCSVSPRSFHVNFITFLTRIIPAKHYFLNHLIHRHSTVTLVFGWFMCIQHCV